MAKAKNVKKVAKPKKVQNKDSFELTMKIRVHNPTDDESQLVGRATKRARVFENAFKDAKKVELHEVKLERL